MQIAESSSSSWRQKRAMRGAMEALRSAIGTRSFRLAVCFFLLGAFATLGNMIAFPDLLPRRWVQLAILLSSLVVALLSEPLAPRLEYLLRHLRERVFWRRLGFLFLPVAIICVVNPIRLDSRVTFESLKTLVMVSGWLFLFNLFFSFTASRCRAIRSALRLPEASGPRRAFFLFLVVCGICLAVKGWWFGPPPGEAYVAFGGSVIVTALCGSIGVFCLLFLYPLGIALLASLPYLYIVLFSTSRTGHILMFSLLFLFALVKFARKPLPLPTALLRGLASFFLPIFLLLLVVFFPIHFESRWYPFHATQEKETLVVLRIEELYNRMSRSLRALNAVGINVDQITLDVMEFLSGASRLKQALFPDKEGDAAARRRQMLIEARFQHMIQVSGSSDDRWTLVKRSWEIVTRNPLGLWPRAFNSEIEVTCATGIMCDYPHNMLLDVAFYFGWLPALCFLGGCAYLTLLLLWQLSISAALVPTVLAACLLNHLLAMQVTGTFIDWFPAYLLLGFWMLELTSMMRGAHPIREQALE